MSKFECIMDNILFPEWAVGIHEYGLTEGLTEDDVSEYESFIEDVIEECTRMGYENIHIQVNYEDDRVFALILNSVLQHSAMAVLCGGVKA